MKLNAYRNVAAILILFFKGGMRILPLKNFKKNQNENC
jgi:hypothetical protein